MKIFDCKKMREIEAKANEAGYSYLSMMENAGKNCSKYIIKILKNKKLTNCKVCILCGKGNNGGDGLVIARCLSENNYDVSVILTHHQMSTDISLQMYNELSGTDVRIYDIYKDAENAINCIMESDTIVDCIFGIGFRGSIDESTGELIYNINRMKKLIISIDIPSGLEGDGKAPEGEHINADFTLAVGCQKPVHILKSASENCGKVLTVDIGFDAQFYGVEESFNVVDDAFIRNVLVKRKHDSNKGTYGKLLNIAGSRNMQGAAVLCAQSAVHSGAGLVTCAFPSKAYPAIAPKLTEPLMMPLASDDKGFLSFGAEKDSVKRLGESDACVIGCGLGLTEDTSLIVYSVIRKAKCPLLIDADGINALASNINILKAAKAPVVLTPHPGEMSRLTGLSIEKIHSERINVSRQFAMMSKAIVVLKGSNTVIALPDGKVYINTTGNGGMAKGGSGDMLSGMIGAFLAEGMDAADAALAGVYLHGKCGDIAAKKYSLTGLTPSLMIKHLPELFSYYE